MAISAQLKALVEQMPDPDQRDMYCTNIDKEKIERAVAEMEKGGPENILGLIDMLLPPGEGDDVKAHYALHCLAVYVCKLPERQHRRQFGEVLASQLGGSRPKAVQAYLCQELQVAGGPEAVPALGKLLLDDELCEPAAMALAAIGDGAAEQFRAALATARGKCRMTVIQNLGVLRDAQSVEALRQALADADREIRILAAWGLANIGDAGSVDLLLKSADTQGWERIQNTKSCLLLAERLAAAGKTAEARKIYQHLNATRTQPHERYIREVAQRGLAAAK